MLDGIRSLISTGPKRRVKRFLTLLAQSLRVPVLQPGEPAPITPAQLAGIARFFSRPKFFVIGYPRSGTTLLARLLRLHPQVHCNWQAHFFSEADSLLSSMVTDRSQVWASRKNNRWTESEDDISLGFRVVCDFVMESQAESEGKRIVGDKSPDANWSSHLVDLHRIYPDASLINIVRDGRDVALSRRVQQLIDQPQALDADGRRLRKSLVGGKPDGSAGVGRLFNKRWLRHEAARWSKEVVVAHRIGRQLFAQRYRAVTFEELLNHPVAVLRSIWLFLGADPDEVPEESIRAELKENPSADWHQQVAPDLTARLPRGEPGGWRRVFLPRDADWFVQFADEGLRAWGYMEGLS